MTSIGSDRRIIIATFSDVRLDYKVTIIQNISMLFLDLKALLTSVCEDFKLCEKFISMVENVTDVVKLEERDALNEFKNCQLEYLIGRLRCYLLHTQVELERIKAKLLIIGQY
jgi:hypothetical protein